MGLEKYRNGFDLTVHENVLSTPYSMKKGRMIFVNSMSDLFHEEVPLEFIQKVFKVMNENPQHTFQVLTKRSDILWNRMSDFKWTDNIWVGVSIENQDHVYRADHLRDVPAKVKFLSLEPLLGPLRPLMLKQIDWVIVGGESGAKSRPIKKEWVLDIRNRCKDQNVPFFFKQWGGRNKKKAGRLLDGKLYSEMPNGIIPGIQK